MDELASEAAAGDFGFLDGLSARRYRDTLKAGFAVPWALGILLENSGDAGRAIEMYAVGAGAKRPKTDDSGFAEWALVRRECLRALVRLETGGKRLQAVRALRFMLADKAITELPEFSLMDIVAQSAELEAAENIILLELGRAGDITGGLSSWLSSVSLSADIVRVVALVPESQLDALSRAEFEWRSAVYARDYQRSWQLASSWLAEYGWPSTRSVLSDLGKAAVYGAGTGNGSAAVSTEADLASMFEAAADSLRSGNLAEARYVLYFYAARLAYRAGSDDRGDRLMLLARDSALTPPDRDSASWYVLDSANRRGFKPLIERVSADSSGWANLSWYLDIIDDRVAALVSARDWKNLGLLRDSLQPVLDRGWSTPGAPELAARLGYIAARTGLLSAEAARLEYERIRHDPDAPTYYRILAADRLGLPFAEFADYSSSLSGRRPPVDSPALVTALKTLLFWNAHEAVWPLVRELGFAPPPSETAEIAKSLGSHGLHSDALRLSITSFAAEGREIGLSDLFAAYPRPWPDEVRAAAESTGTGEILLYGLIRSESFFDPSVSSVAGAIGLTQLMESTAADMARKQRLEDYDLTDPAVSIRLGSAYYGELLGRLENRPLDAVFAYNAGITRLRQWRRAFGSLDDDLFLESVPYAETREYGRKVLVAAVFYGYLYYRESAEQSVRLIFKTKG